ncbi:MAG: hypothetical protein ACYDGM_12315 [Vulcanimicrobiaceae bacterium]
MPKKRKPESRLPPTPGGHFVHEFALVTSSADLKALRCRFRTAWSVHNTCIKYLRDRDALRRAEPAVIAIRQQEKDWHEADEAQFGKANTPKKREEKKKRIKLLRDATDNRKREEEIDTRLGLTRSALKSWVTRYFGGKPLRSDQTFYGPHTIGAKIIQTIAQEVWKSYEAYRYPSGGRKVGLPGFARLREFPSVSGMGGYGNVLSGELRWSALEEILTWSNGQKGTAKRELHLRACPLRGDPVRDHVRALSIPDNTYIDTYGSLHPLARETRNVQQVRIVRRQIRTKVRYFAQIVYAGESYRKLENEEFLSRLRTRMRGLPATPSENVVGVDLGTQHVGIVSDEVALLAPLVATFERHGKLYNRAVVKRHKCLVRTSRYIDRSFRATYPERFNPDGTHKTATKWDDDHQEPKRLREKRDRIERERARKRKRRMIRQKKRARAKAKKAGAEKPKMPLIVVSVGEKRAPVSHLPRRDRSAESRSYRAARRKIADMKRSEARTRLVENRTLVNAICGGVGLNIATEDVSVKGWQKSCGKSVGLFSPGAFLTRLKYVAMRYGGSVTNIPTNASRLSQLCPACGGYTKTEIRGKVAQRMSICAHCDRPKIHRDLLASFCARFASGTGVVDAESARRAWESFSGESLLRERGAWLLDGGLITTHGAVSEGEANTTACGRGLARETLSVDGAPKSPVPASATPLDSSKRRKRSNPGNYTQSSGATAQVPRSPARNDATTSKKEQRRHKRRAYRASQTIAAATRSKTSRETRLALAIAVRGVAAAKACE